MSTIIKDLFSGDALTASQFAKADAFWTDFMAAHANDSPDQLAKALGDSQGTLDRVFGSHDRAKDGMPYSAFQNLFDAATGYSKTRPLAKRVLAAFGESMCSIEVKSHAKSAAAFFKV